MCLSKAGQSDYKPVARYKLARLFTIGSQHVRYKQPQKPTFHPVTALGGACLGLPQSFFHFRIFFLLSCKRQPHCKYEFCKLLMAYSQFLLFQRILWATATALLWQNQCRYIHLLNIIDHRTLSIYVAINVAIDLPSEGRLYSVRIVSFELLCINWNVIRCRQHYTGNL